MMPRRNVEIANTSNLILRSAHLRASRRMAASSAVPVAILRDGRPSKSAVADFDTLTLPKSGTPDFGGRPPQDEVGSIFTPP
jgi:hypothetical protein